MEQTETGTKNGVQQHKIINEEERKKKKAKSNTRQTETGTQNGAQQYSGTKSAVIIFLGYPPAKRMRLQESVCLFCAQGCRDEMKKGEGLPQGLPQAADATTKNMFGFTCLSMSCAQHNVF